MTRIIVLEENPMFTIHLLRVEAAGIMDVDGERMVNHGKRMVNHILVGKWNSSTSVIQVGLLAAGNMIVGGECMVASRGKHTPNDILVGKRNSSRSIIQVGLPFANGLGQHCLKPNMNCNEV